MSCYWRAERELAEGEPIPIGRPFDNTDIMLITDEGVVIRMAVNAIRETGRSTQGVRLMRLAEGSQVISVACTEKEETVAEEAIAAEKALEEAAAAEPVAEDRQADE